MSLWGADRMAKFTNGARSKIQRIVCRRRATHYPTGSVRARSQFTFISRFVRFPRIPFPSRIGHLGVSLALFVVSPREKKREKRKPWRIVPFTFDASSAVHLFYQSFSSYVGHCVLREHYKIRPELQRQSPPAGRTTTALLPPIIVIVRPNTSSTLRHKTPYTCESIPPTRRRRATTTTTTKSETTSF